MTTRPRRTTFAVLGSILALALAFATFTAAPSGAAEPSEPTPLLPLEWNVDASTHIGSLGMDVEIPRGTFDGWLMSDLTIVGDLELPPASKTIRVFGLPIATTTFAMSQNGPITGVVDLVAGTVTVDSSFNFAIESATTPLLPRLNLVGKNCQGTKPIDVTMTGDFDLDDLDAPQTFQADYSLPKLKNCGLGTGLMNLILPGGGNTFTASFGPAV